MNDPDPSDAVQEDLDDAAREKADAVLRTGEDPTQSILSKSDLHSKHLCDYIVNVAMGCRHGCEFCYVPSTPVIRMRQEELAEAVGVEDPQAEWGTYVLHRAAEEVGDRLDSLLANKRTWKTTDGGRGVVWLSSGTDCYQDAETAAVTREVVEALVAHDKPVRILTRNPRLAATDIDLFQRAAEQDLITVGSSIPSLDATEVGAIEPNAPPPQARLDGLAEIAEAGVPTFVSMSPTYPTATPGDIREMVETFDGRLPTLDVIFHETINRRGGNLSGCAKAASDAAADIETRIDIGDADSEAVDRHNTLRSLAAALATVDKSQTEWLRYAMENNRAVEAAGSDAGVDVLCWPGDILSVADDGTEAHAWAHTEYQRASPEDFASELEVTP